MKKNKPMRAAAMLAVATLLTTCLIGGTYAKYTTAVSTGDSARVANWGFESVGTIDLGNLFAASYTSVASSDSADVIAPGTSGNATFTFAYDESAADAPEVAYDFTVSVTDSCGSGIKSNPDIQFKLDNGSWGTWDQLIAGLKAPSGDASGTKSYAAGTLPAGFTASDDVHTVAWQWLYTDSGSTDTQNTCDTTLGNADTLAKCSLNLTISAVQKD